MKQILVAIILLLAGDAQAGSFNTQANNFMFATTRTRINTNIRVVASGEEFGVSQMKLGQPEYQTNDYRCGFTGWYVAPATTTPEVATGNSQVVRGASLVVNGVYYPLSSNGSTGPWTVSSGSYLWTDAKHLPASIRQTDTVYLIVESNSVVGANQVGGARLKAYLNEGLQYSSSNLDSFLTGGTIGTGAGSGAAQYAYTANTCVARGWDGRPVALLYGDSIDYGSVEFIQYGGLRGEQGWLERGTSSTAYGARRYPAFNIGVATSKMADIPTVTQLAMRAAFFGALPNLPFNRIYVQGGTNDGTNSAPTWQAAFNSGWASLTTTWPSAPATQFTMPAKVSALGTAGFTTVVDQGWTANPWWTPSTGAGDTVNSYILTVPAPLTSALDVRPAFSGTSVGGSVNTWREDIYAISCTISTTGVTAGQTFIKSSCPLNINTVISVGGGTAQVEQVVVSSDPSTVSCPCQSSVASAFVNNHNIADTIKETPTLDGTHGASTAYQRTADEAIAFAKKTGVLN